MYPLEPGEELFSIDPLCQAVGAGQVDKLVHHYPGSFSVRFRCCLDVAPGSDRLVWPCWRQSAAPAFYLQAETLAAVEFKPNVPALNESFVQALELIVTETGGVTILGNRKGADCLPAD